MATPTYTINSIDASGNINITIFAGSSYKNYYFEVWLTYSIVLISARQQSDSYTYTHTYPCCIWVRAVLSIK